MKKRTLIVLTAAVLGMVFVFALAYATQPEPETITMDKALLGKHKKALVTFSHKKHSTDYKVSCADCHHVYKEGTNVWKQGDEVEKCDACHAEAKAPSGDKSPKEEKIKKYYYDAIHANCVACHKEQKKGPAKCAECHPKAPGEKE
jgi:ribosomal protein S27E